MRKLASIQEINTITPIEGKDRIVLATVQGWQVIVQKGEYKPGDRAVFVEPDSILPAEPQYAFLEKRKYRIKTMKMGGVLSQGICFPISHLPEGKYKLEQDVTELMKIKKHEPFAQKSSTNTPKQKRKWWWKLLARSKYTRWLCPFKKDRHRWPEFVTKTDEIRCLTANTKIKTNEGYLRIGDIVNKRLQCKVASYNEKTKNIEYKDIIDYQKYPMDDTLYEIEFAYKFNSERKNRVVCTGDHPFAMGDNYINARELKTNDMIKHYACCYPDNIAPIVLGMALGDCHVSKDKRSHNGKNRLYFTQGEAQYDYLLHKLSLFGSDTPNINEGKSGYGSNKIYQTALKIDENINKILQEHYGNNNRQITKELLQKMNEISLAYWYMDDGSLVYRDGSKTPKVRLHTCRYTKQENEIIVEWLASAFGVEAYVAQDKTYFSITVRPNSTEKFLRCVTPHIYPTMRYKTLESMENSPYTVLTPFTKKETVMCTPITSIKELTNKNKFNRAYVYDITVQDNHNFFANRVLTHNCQNLPSILTNKDTSYIVREKIEGQSGTYVLKRTKKWFSTKPEFMVCSRNVRLASGDEGSYGAIAKKFKIKGVLEHLIGNKDYVILQGECVGPNIQGNMYKLDDHDFFAFNLIYPDGIIPCSEAEPILMDHGIKWCPLIDTDVKLPDTVNEVLDYAGGDSVVYPTMREGLVFRNYDTKVSFKAVSPDYLIKRGY